MRPKTIATVIVTALVLALAIDKASANSLSISRQNIRATWTSLKLENTARTEETILCETILEGSFHSATIPKGVGALIGYITRATTNNPCTGGTMTVGQGSLPWHIRYRGFTGTLPAITGVQLGLIGIDLILRTAGGTTCEAKTEAERPFTATMNINERTDVAESLTPDTSTRIPLRNPGSEFLCPLASGYFEGATTGLTQLGSTASFSITLIAGIPGNLEPSPVAFGRLEPSQLSLRTATITASSEGFTVNRISMARANYFAITDPNRCASTRLAERARCSFKVVFVAPAETGRTLEDTITVETTGETLRDTVRGET